MPSARRKLIISLSTIPPRFDAVGAVLRDLLAQTVRPDEIRLNLARSYRRFPGALPSLPPLPEGVTVHWSDIDHGPATKVLPTLAAYRGQDVEILFSDDDQSYAPRLAEILLSRRAAHPHSCITALGYRLDERKPPWRYLQVALPQPPAERRRKGFDYRLRRAASLGLWKPRPRTRDGHVHVLEGYGGTLVRPGFFPPEVFDIPDILWTVDDPWLSGHITRMGVPILQVRDFPLRRTRAEIHRRNPLGKFSHRAHDRLAADTLCIDYFRQVHGIWQGVREAGPDPSPTDIHTLLAAA
ncbi:glycosyltransferase family 2 protein [Rhodobacterales bacterium HKCCSP123]|nr:glycosyltransferase family 2 protein [Rhodobacterales bacterium HKCCSP123]